MPVASFRSLEPLQAWAWPEREAYVLLGRRSSVLAIFDLMQQAADFFFFERMAAEPGEGAGDLLCHSLWSLRLVETCRELVAREVTG